MWSNSTLSKELSNYCSDLKNRPNELWISRRKIVITFLVGRSDRTK
jgi:hypothetical protein